jgi:hypothetical protein
MAISPYKQVWPVTCTIWEHVYPRVSEWGYVRLRQKHCAADTRWSPETIGNSETYNRWSQPNPQHARKWAELIDLETAATGKDFVAEIGAEFGVVDRAMMVHLGVAI